MISTNQVTKLSTYKEYLSEIGVVPTYQLEKAFDCGLPAVWLYLKAIGLEDLYFELLEKISTRPALFKELFYLLILTNGQNKFFPHVAKDFLDIQIPRQIAAAQIELQKPDFAVVYSFTAEQLLETLQNIAKPNVMIRIGNERNAIGLMFNEDVYHVYHANNPRVLEFKTLDRCVDLIMRVIKKHG